MLRATGYLLIFLAMFSIAGGHWAVLQSVAWTRMLVEYSKSLTLGAAISKTFSGEAPCAMCQQITKARQQEEKAPATVKVDKKAEKFFCAERDISWERMARHFSYPSPDNTACAARSDEPPCPVPRTRIFFLA